MGDVAGTAGSRTWVAVQSRGPGKTYRDVTYLSSDLSWAAPPYAYACGCVLAYADRRLIIMNYFNTYTHPTDPPIAHLRGQHPMTASEPPAKWVADSRGDDNVVCRVEEGRAAAARRRRGNQTRERKNGKVPSGSGAANRRQEKKNTQSRHGQSDKSRPLIVIIILM